MPRFTHIGQVTLSSNVSHAHDFWEISVYTSGNGVATVGDRPIPFETGSVILYPPVIAHKEDAKRPYCEYYLHCAGDLGYAKEPQLFTDSASGMLRRIASLLHEEYVLQQSGWRSAAQDLFDLFLLQVSRQRKVVRRHPMVERLQSVLLENLHDPSFKVADAMSRLPISIDHLRERFEEATGETPLRWLTTMRVREAKNLLKRGFSVKEAAFQVGIQDPYYFSRMFFKATGVRPSEYARR